MKKRYTAPLVWLGLFVSLTACGQSAGPELRTVRGQFMQYYISLPSGWTAGTRWPVVIALEDADKQFKKNTERFSTARGNKPFIIVVPFITTNGRQGQRDPAVYPYSPAAWDSIEKMTNCLFDMNGMKGIIRDVNENFGGTDKVFLTGFEAGTHLLWALVFQHPEWLYAAAPVAGNFINRCMDSSAFSTNSSREQLPVNNFTGSADKFFGVNGSNYYQYLEAKKIAEAHGFKNFTGTEVAGKDHVPLPDQVLDYFYSLWIKLK